MPLMPKARVEEGMRENDMVNGCCGGGSDLRCEWNEVGKDEAHS